MSKKFGELDPLVLFSGRGLSSGETSEPFDFTNGVMQGGVLVLVLFNLFLSVLCYAVRDQDVYFRSRLDRSVSDLRRLSAKTKTVEKVIPEALSADDARLLGLTISQRRGKFWYSRLQLLLLALPLLLFSIKGTELRLVEDF